MNGPWPKVNGRKMIEMNGINERDERNRVNEKMNCPWIKVGGRKIDEIDVMKGEHDRKRRMQGGVRPVIRICGDSMVKNVSRYVRMSGSNGCRSLGRKGIKEICEYADKVIDDMDEGMVIVQGCGNGLLENASAATMNVIMKMIERAQKKNVRVAVKSLLRRPACNEYERSRKESVWKHEIGSSFLDMDSLIQAGCFLRDGVPLSQEGEKKLSQRFIRSIKATHLLMEGRID
ncbi:hypothetical protein FHG87_012095 [Trinorchestia longiramus]|nr:hypothetical protein FHG87_012095 [Trinorchestia longiramus]